MYERRDKYYLIYCITKQFFSLSQLHQQKNCSQPQLITSFMIHSNLLCGFLINFHITLYIYIWESYLIASSSFFFQYKQKTTQYLVHLHHKIQKHEFPLYQPILTKPTAVCLVLNGMNNFVEYSQIFHTCLTYSMDFKFNVIEALWVCGYKFRDHNVVKKYNYLGSIHQGKRKIN